jgi:uncharacterized membrane protein YcaP (DUF421 family)
MTSILRAAVMYLFLLVVLRLTGKRSLAQTTTFDFVLLLIIAESSQQALAGQDFSIANAVLIIVTLILLDIGISLWKERSPTLERIIDGVPLVLVENGQPIRQRMIKTRVDEEDILNAARLHQGLERMDQIKYAVLERSGEISIVPKASAQG